MRMRTKELKILIEAAESLGHWDLEMVIDNGRDGVESYTPAIASLEKVGPQQDSAVLLVIREVG